jgi:hypothetical protein
VTPPGEVAGGLPSDWRSGGGGGGGAGESHRRLNNMKDRLCIRVWDDGQVHGASRTVGAGLACGVRAGDAEQAAGGEGGHQALEPPGDAVAANPGRPGERRVAHAAGDGGAQGGHDEADPTGGVGGIGLDRAGSGTAFTTLFLL